MLPVLRALCAAHALGIMHRDVKASNILLGAQGQVKLADWGICGRVAPAQAGPQASDTGVSPAALCIASEPARGRIQGPAVETQQEGSARVLGSASGHGRGAGGPSDRLNPSEDQASDPQAPDRAVAAPMGTIFWAAPELDAGLPHDQ